MKVLGIETSCDDTSVALYDSERGVAENLLSSQVDLHDQFGGVVPELASRAHLVNLLPLVDHLMQRQQITPRDLDGVAVTSGPGLIGALLVGLSTAKALARAIDRPLVGVHHLEGHILANALSAPLVLPAVCLVVSGGHTELILAREVGVYERLGATLAAAGLDAPKRKVPVAVAKFGGRMAERIWESSGREDDPPMTEFLAEQLSTAHWFDQRETRQALEWQPAVGLDEGFARLRAWFATQG